MNHSDLEGHVENMSGYHGYPRDTIPAPELPAVIPEIREGSVPVPINDSEVQSMPQMQYEYNCLADTLQMEQTSPVVVDSDDGFQRPFMQEPLASNGLTSEPLVNIFNQRNATENLHSGTGVLPGDVQSSPSFAFVKHEPDDAMPVSTDTDESQTSTLLEDRSVKMETSDNDMGDSFSTTNSSSPLFENFSTVHRHPCDGHGRNSSSSNGSFISAPLAGQDQHRLSFRSPLKRKRKHIDFWKSRAFQRTETVPGYCCKFCLYTFRTLRTLDNHIATDHLEDLSTVRSKWSLQYQGVICKKCEGKYALCIYCGEEFYGKRSIKKHILNHKLDKTFRCNICQETFSRKTSRYHLLVHKDLRANCRPCVRLGRQQSRPEGEPFNKRAGLRSQDFPEKNAANQPGMSLPKPPVNLGIKELKIVLERIDLHAIMKNGTNISIPAHLLDSKLDQSVQMSENGPDKEKMSSNPGMDKEPNREVISGDHGLDNGSNVAHVPNQPTGTAAPNRVADTLNTTGSTSPSENTVENKKEDEVLEQICMHSSSEMIKGCTPAQGISLFSTVEDGIRHGEASEIFEELKPIDHVLDHMSKKREDLTPSNLPHQEEKLLDDATPQVCEAALGVTKDLSNTDLTDPGEGLSISVKDIMHCSEKSPDSIQVVQLSTCLGLNEKSTQVFGQESENTEKLMPCCENALESMKESECSDHALDEQSTQVCKQTSERRNDLTPAPASDQGLGSLAIIGEPSCEKRPEGLEFGENELAEQSVRFRIQASTVNHGLIPAEGPDQDLSIRIEMQASAMDRDVSPAAVNDDLIRPEGSDQDQSAQIEMQASAMDGDVSLAAVNDDLIPAGGTDQDPSVPIEMQASATDRDVSPAVNDDLIPAGGTDQDPSMSIEMQASATYRDVSPAVNDDLIPTGGPDQDPSTRIEMQASAMEGDLSSAAVNDDLIPAGGPDQDPPMQTEMQASAMNRDVSPAEGLDIDVDSSLMAIDEEILQNMEELNSGDQRLSDGSNKAPIVDKASQGIKDLTAADVQNNPQANNQAPESRTTVDVPIQKITSSNVMEDTHEEEPKIMKELEGGSPDIDSGLSQVCKNTYNMDGDCSLVLASDRRVCSPVPLEGEVCHVKTNENLEKLDSGVHDGLIVMSVSKQVSERSKPITANESSQKVDLLGITEDASLREKSLENMEVSEAGDLDSDNGLNIATASKLTSETNVSPAATDEVHEGGDLPVTLKSVHPCENGPESVEKISINSESFSDILLLEQVLGQELSDAVCGEGQLKVPFQGPDSVNQNEFMQPGECEPENTNFERIYKQVCEHASNHEIDLPPKEDIGLGDRPPVPMNDSSNQSKLSNGGMISQQIPADCREHPIARSTDGQLAVSIEGVDLMDLEDAPGETNDCLKQSENWKYCDQNAGSLIPEAKGNSMREVGSATGQIAKCSCSEKDELGLLCHVCGPDFIENLLSKADPHLFGLESSAGPNVTNGNLLDTVKHGDDKPKPKISGIQYSDTTTDCCEIKTPVLSSAQSVEGHSSKNEEAKISDGKETVGYKKKSRTFSCRKCDKVYTNKILFASHVRKMHRKVTRQKKTTLRDGKKF